MRETAIIFDHDGTLVDSIHAGVICTNIVLKNAGFPVQPDAEIIQYLSEPTASRFRRHTGITDVKKLKTMSGEFFKAMHNGGIEYLKAYPGISETLDTLSDAGFSMGMVSNNQGAFVRKVAARLEYSYDLEIILGEENVRAVKPAPDGLLQACAGLGAVPQKSWYIGDSDIDHASARAAGMKSGLVTWGVIPAEELKSCGADALWDSPAEMRDFFLDLAGKSG